MSAADFSGVGRVALGVARVLLSDDDVRRIVEPAVADLRFECRTLSDRGRWGLARRRQAQGAWMLAGLVARLYVQLRARRARDVSWWLLVAAVAAVLIPLPALSAIEPQLARAQMIYGAIGLFVAALTATASAAAIERSSTKVAAISLVALASVALVGVEHDGARRWLSIAGLTVHVASLVAPMWAVAVAGLAKRRVALPAVACAGLALVVATRDVATAALYALVAFAAALHANERATAAKVGAAGVVAVGVAWSREPWLAPVPHVEGIFDVLALRGSMWPFAAAAALVALAVGAIVVTRSARDPFAARLATVACFSVVAQPLLALASSGPIPLVGYGGSTVIASFAMVGLIIRARVGARDPKLGAAS
ncbi:MAG: FtsW/RodA/SpoVE family cell cycle protein [Polyangiaceae bacterium]|nr:FtsW/RodA/SpoVE family cell cycle protein [Polyangiaceae bacterium]